MPRSSAPTLAGSRGFHKRQVYGSNVLGDASEEATRGNSANGELDERQEQARSSAQKRRRVRRACDECRQKKIKCDSKHPCAHCIGFLYDCTYDQPSRRRRQPQPLYLEQLETKLSKFHAILRYYHPDLSLEDENIRCILQSAGVEPNIPAASARVECSRTESNIPTIAAHMQIGIRESYNSTGGNCHSTPPFDDTNLESMVDATGQLDVDQTGNWDYSGHSSNLPSQLPPTQHQGARTQYLKPQFHITNHSGSFVDARTVDYSLNNPSTYPVQPVNTLEQHYALQGTPSRRVDFDLSIGVLSPPLAYLRESGSSDDQIDFQLSRPLPAYMYAQQHRSDQSPWSSEAGNDGPSNVPHSRAAMWNQQARSNGSRVSNFDDIFPTEVWQDNTNHL